MHARVEIIRGKTIYLKSFKVLQRADLDQVHQIVWLPRYVGKAIRSLVCTPEDLLLSKRVNRWTNSLQRLTS